MAGFWAEAAWLYPYINHQWGSLTSWAVDMMVCVCEQFHIPVNSDHLGLSQSVSWLLLNKIRFWLETSQSSSASMDINSYSGGYDAWGSWTARVKHHHRGGWSWLILQRCLGTVWVPVAQTQYSMLNYNISINQMPPLVILYLYWNVILRRLLLQPPVSQTHLTYWPRGWELL